MRPPYVAVILGTFGALFPEAIINWMKRVILGPSFENTTALEPRDWYVAGVRVQATFVALAGITWLVLERRQSKADHSFTPDLTPTEE